MEPADAARESGARRLDGRCGNVFNATALNFNERHILFAIDYARVAGQCNIFEESAPVFLAPLRLNAPSGASGTRARAGHRSSGARRPLDLCVKGIDVFGNIGGTVVARENGFPANLLSPVFLIGELRIGSISDASCLNMGNNYPTQFESHKKQNQGFGSIIGDHNGIEDIRTLLNDPDFIDMLGNLNGEGLQALAEQWWADGQVDKV